MEKLIQLIDMIRLMEEDYKKFHEQHNRKAGIRLRKKLQEIRILAKTMRDEIQETRQLFEPKIPRGKK